MPRKPNLDRPVAQMLKLPESVRARLALHLFSEVEGRVPKGAFQSFFLDRIREYFESEELDLAPYVIGAESGHLIVRGSPAAIARIKRRFEDVQS